MSHVPDVSLVSAVYNVKPYLADAVRSMLNQTHQNIEVILVDDGSTDGSGALCDELARADARVRVIHQENKGTGMARNAGMDAARGTYIYFCDPDDLLDASLVETAFAAAEAHQAEMVVFGYEQRAYGVYEDKVALPSIEGCVAREEFFAAFEKYFFMDSLWTRLVRRQYLVENHLRSTTLRTGQDAVLAYDLLCAPFQRIAFVQKPLYIYIPRKTSATIRFKPERMENHFEVAKRYQDSLRFAPDEEVRNRLAAKMYFAQIGKCLMHYYQSSQMPFAEVLRVLRRCCQRPDCVQAFRHMKIRDYSGLQKIKALLLKHRCCGLYLVLFYILRLTHQTKPVE